MPDLSFVYQNMLELWSETAGVVAAMMYFSEH